MIMHFKMMEFSIVCGLVKEQLFTAALAYLLDLSLVFSPLPLPQLVFLLLPLPQNKKRWQSSNQTKHIEITFSFSDTSSRPWVKMSKIILKHWYKLSRPYLRSKLNYHGRQRLKCSGASFKWVLMNIVLSSNEQKCISDQNKWPFHMLDSGR